MYKSDTIHRKVISSALRRERCHCLIWSLHCWIVRVTLNPPHWDGKKVFQSYTDPEFIYIGAVLYKAWSNPSYWSTAITTLAVVVGDPKLFLAWGSDRSRETKRSIPPLSKVLPTARLFAKLFLVSIPVGSAAICSCTVPRPETTVLETVYR